LTLGTASGGGGGSSVTRLLCAVAMTAAGAATAAQPASLGDVLARAEQYVTQYERRFSALVAEEHYVLEVRRPAAQRGGVRESRTLRSDYLLVQLDAGAGWMPFRDVFEVDGRRVRDREDRLGRLFMVPATEAAFDQAVRIMADSTRYDLGGVTRTINVPTLALLFLHPEEYAGTEDDGRRHRPRRAGGAATRHALQRGRHVLVGCDPRDDLHCACHAPPTLAHARETLTVSLPPRTKRLVARAASESGLTTSECVRMAIHRKLWQDALTEARRVAVPRARAKGSYTDEDVFALIS
jgi:hypothetical protein